MRTRVLLLACFALLAAPAVSLAFIEAPHSMGRICNESTNIVVMEVARVDAKKNLII